jgi:hypothetical protein
VAVDAVSVAVSAARLAVSVAPAAVRLTAAVTVPAVSAIAFVAFPSKFPTVSAERVSVSGAGLVS